jgi:quinol monooxygenase YgiN
MRPYQVLGAEYARRVAETYEIFTYGRFEVAPEKETAFVGAWSEFAAWVSERPGNTAVRLHRDLRNAGRFVSVGQWDNAEAVRAFKSSPDFKERLGGVVRHAKEFEPTDLVTLVKAGGGTVKTLSPPADLEPIHAPT